MKVWHRTSPSPDSKAYVYTVNGREKSGFQWTNELVRACLTAWKARSGSSVHHTSWPFLIRSEKVGA